MNAELAIETCRFGYRARHRNVYRWIQSQEQKSVEMDTEAAAKPIVVI